MSDTVPLAFKPGRFGKPSHVPGLVIGELVEFALASVVARRSKEHAVVEAAMANFQLAPPLTAKIVTAAGMAFIWSGPGHWLALAETSTASIEERLGPLVSCASVFDQGDSRVMLELTGANVRQALAKGVALDLHPRAFGPGDAALTSVSHVGMQLWQLTEAPVYRLLVPRGYFLSFWRWLAASSAEFGGELLPPRRYTAGTGTSRIS